MSWIQNFFASRIVITAKAEAEEDAEIVDPQQVLRDKCRQQPKCVALQEKLDECNKRVTSRKQTAEICAEELYDLFHCVDFCVAKDLFKQLK